MSSRFALPTPAQLMRLRRAGVEAWTLTVGDETLTLPLRPLNGGQRRVKPQRAASHRAAAATPAADWASLSRGQRRRRNVACKKEFAATTLQRHVRNFFIRKSFRAAVQARRSCAANRIQSTARSFLARARLAASGSDESSDESSEVDGEGDESDSVESDSGESDIDAEDDSHDDSDDEREEERLQQQRRQRRLQRQRQEHEQELLLQQSAPAPRRSPRKRGFSFAGAAERAAFAADLAA